jgi:predicted transcriptional regulator
MSTLTENYKKIILEIEQTISNDKEREIVKEKILELSALFIDQIDNLSNVADKKIEKLEEKQKYLDDKMNELQSSINEIEGDIYDEEEGDFDFEIICPYCNNEFEIDLSIIDESKNEIRCPECNNIIELDWNGEEDEGCSGHCGGCHGCGEDEEDDEDM